MSLVTSYLCPQCPALDSDRNLSVDPFFLLHQIFTGLYPNNYLRWYAARHDVINLSFLIIWHKNLHILHLSPTYHSDSLPLSAILYTHCTQKPS
jgi:hypothetical protein